MYFQFMCNLGRKNIQHKVFNLFFLLIENFICFYLVSVSSIKYDRYHEYKKKSSDHSILCNLLATQIRFLQFLVFC